MALSIKSAGTAMVMEALLIMITIPWLRPSGAEPIMTDPVRCLDLDPNWICCPPPTNEKIVDFKPQPQPTRVRRPAHSLDQEAARKYEKAVALMRALPEEHPWNFIQQAKVHCSYCSGGYLQLGLNISMEIHGSWHLFTWHRAYLYFYERILGKLIDDPSFALPFWNWDDPAGMRIPPIFTESSSSLFNPTRYPAALRFIDLSGVCRNETTLAKQKRCNLQLMNRQFAATLNLNVLFFGSPYRAGDPRFPGPSIFESTPHNKVHILTSLDMKNSSGAARDPIFFAHHANFDRLWAIWESMSNDKTYFNDRDFLDASFIFWDEDLKRVRIHVRDLIDTRGLGYVYEDVPQRWMNLKASTKLRGFAKRTADETGESHVLPTVLSSEIRVKVARKAGAEREILVVSGIELDGRDNVWFVVQLMRMFGNYEQMEIGCFVHMGRGAKDKIPITTKLQIGITPFVQQLGAESDVVVVVILTPKRGGDKINIGDVSIGIV